MTDLLAQTQRRKADEVLPCAEAALGKVWRAAARLKSGQVSSDTIRRYVEAQKKRG
ncbi:hypothetical protein SAMN05421543_12346 [Alicyclobacillus macrosporangiidus]|uniref:Uncharacterized protein n=1 Tax=Alicyclobacillus macrosporangiidus TaxID=392015 RepID=A0A1I7L253_9BACL|nr:hypothetical protein SAMN05421543_12346 [Alicyclobacillus macrosporangiidus]